MPGFSSALHVASRRYVFLHIVFSLLFRFGLDYVYINITYPVFEYMGYPCNPTVNSMLLSYVYLFFGIMWTMPIYKSHNVFRANIVLLLYYFSFIPTSSVIGCAAQPVKYIIATLVYYFLFFFLVDRIKIPMIKQYRIKGIVPIVAALFCSVVIFISWRWTGFRFTLSLRDVYAMRFEARTFNIPAILAYLWNAAGNVLPLLIAYYINKKKYWPALVVALVIILNFSIDGMKSTLFKLIMCVFFYFFLKKDPRFILGMLFVVLVGAAMVEYWLTGGDSIAITYIRRNFFLPSYLDTLYFDAVEKNGLLFYSHRVNGTLIEFYIGDEYFDRDYMRANNGMFSDAYRNLGLVGVVVYPIVYAMLFSFFEALIKGHAVWILFFTSFICTFTLRASELTTAMLTHGLFFVMMTLYLMPRFRNAGSVGNVNVVK